MKPQAVLNLSEYPALIAELRQEILDLKQDLRILKDSEAWIGVGLQHKVANDPELTNDTKRKAALAELMHLDADLRMTRNEISQVEGMIAQREIVLSLRLDEFSVRKLELRMETAKLMVQLEAA